MAKPDTVPLAPSGTRRAGFEGVHILAWLLLVLALPAIAASRVSVGAKGGVLLGPGDTASPVGGRGGVGERRDFVRPYVVGAAAVVDLPLGGLCFEANAFYRRFSRDESRFRGGFGNIQRFSGNTLEFPVLLEKRLPLGTFAGAGASFRHIWNPTLETEVFNGGMAPDQVFGRQEVDLGDANQGGWVLTGGLERDLGGLRWSVEVRYTRWTSLLFQPSRNQADLLIGFRF
jgi:hypothetical protein